MNVKNPTQAETDDTQPVNASASQTKSAGRHSSGSAIARFGWLIVAIAGVLMAAQVLPLDRAVQAMERWNAQHPWSTIGLFVAVYIVATILMLPASLLTLAAGAIFGLWWGTAAVSVGSNLGAAAALLIGRYLARSRIETRFGQSPKFKAIDHAIREGGWKIVAMLRLSPAVPFNLQNYLYGLTSIRFWTCVLTSWLFMLPGTFMYVYLGYIGRVAAAGGDEPIGTKVLKGIGLLATIVVTIYITRLAAKALKQQTDVDDQVFDEDAGSSETPASAQANATEDVNETGSKAQQPGSLGLLLKWSVAILLLAAGIVSMVNKQAIAAKLSGLFGPPAVVLKESYQPRPDGKVLFDADALAAFDSLLKDHVDADGFVDYRAIQTEPARLTRFTKALEATPFDDMGRDEKLVVLINAYNAFTLQLILDHLPPKDATAAEWGITDIPNAERWDAVRWKVGRHTWSLNQIEHEQVRPHFLEPRIHFALVCAALSCPPLRNEAYTVEKLESQLADQTRYVHTHKTWYHFDEDSNVVSLTSLYDWYGGDFKQVADGSVLNYVARHDSALRTALDAGRKPRLTFSTYYWHLNSVENKAVR